LNYPKDKTFDLIKRNLHCKKKFSVR